MFRLEPQAMYSTLIATMAILELLTALCWAVLAGKGIHAIVTRRLTKRTSTLIGTAAVRDGVFLTTIGGALSAVAITLSALILRRIMQP
jgi:hypothetical protein